MEGVRDEGSCIDELYEKWYLHFCFSQTGIFRGVFSIYYFAGKISEAAMGGAGDIIFHRLGAQWKDTLYPYVVIFRGFLLQW
jgi:hypothetical protein